MRGRLILIVILTVLAFGFAALNWSEVVHTAPLSFGVLIREASVGLVLLTLLAVTLICFMVASSTQETRHLIDYGKHQRALQTQRDLADKAETSRYVELQAQLKSTNQLMLTQLREIETRLHARFEHMDSVAQFQSEEAASELNHVKL